ncbi:MAG: UDP-2,3-diacylglucosamine diphosphatase [Thioalkalivibrionaceae bacterium]
MSGDVDVIQARTVFISDVHLGTRECRAGYLRDFLETLECQRLVLVGDIFDLWAMKRRVSWDDDQTAVVERVFEMAAQGVEVIYIPGNHDAAARTLVGQRIRGVRVERNFVHVGEDGRRWFVSHGDEFDAEVSHPAWIQWLGDFGYNLALRAGNAVHRVRRVLGLRYWSASAWLKSHVGQARAYIDRFERTAAATARRQGFDGYLCGHIHKAAVREIDGVTYANCGDWVEHCSALLEEPGGRLALWHWSDHARVERIEAATAALTRWAPELDTPLHEPFDAPHDDALDGALDAWQETGTPQRVKVVAFASASEMSGSEANAETDRGKTVPTIGVLPEPGAVASALVNGALPADLARLALAASVGGSLRGPGVGVERFCDGHPRGPMRRHSQSASDRVPEAAA